MSHKGILNTLRIKALITYSIKELLSRKENPTVAEVRERLEYLGDTLYKNKTIVDKENDGFKIAYVGKLWDSWTLKQKLKWLFYNKTPIIKQMSKEMIRLIDDRNSIASVEPEVFDQIKYPPHLEPNPNGIIVTNVNIKLNKGIEFIMMDLEIGGMDEEDK